MWAMPINRSKLIAVGFMGLVLLMSAVAVGLGLMAVYRR